MAEIKTESRTVVKITAKRTKPVRLEPVSGVERSKLLTDEQYATECKKILPFAARRHAATRAMIAKLEELFGNKWDLDYEALEHSMELTNLASPFACCHCRVTRPPGLAVEMSVSCPPDPDHDYSCVTCYFGNGQEMQDRSNTINLCNEDGCTIMGTFNTNPAQPPAVTVHETSVDHANCDCDDE